MKTNDAKWNSVFNSEDTAWLELLDNEQADSVEDVLESIVDEISYLDIDTLRDITYTKYKAKVGVTEFKELMLLNAIDLLRIQVNNNYSLYCDISVYEIENLIFRKLGAADGFVFYEILLKDGMEYTKMELAVVDDAD